MQSKCLDVGKVSRMAFPPPLYSLTTSRPPLKCQSPSVTLSRTPVCLQMARGESQGDAQSRFSCHPQVQAPLRRPSGSVLLMVVLWDSNVLLGTQHGGRKPHFWQDDWSVSSGFS